MQSASGTIPENENKNKNKNTAQLNSIQLNSTEIKTSELLWQLSNTKSTGELVQVKGIN